MPPRLRPIELTQNRKFRYVDWYGINADAFIAHLWDYHYTFSNLTSSGNLWVTEWACHNFVSNQQCSQSDVNSFMNQTQNFMDETEWVERYAWFGAMRNLQGVNPVSKHFKHLVPFEFVVDAYSISGQWPYGFSRRY